MEAFVSLNSSPSIMTQLPFFSYFFLSCHSVKSPEFSSEGNQNFSKLNGGRPLDRERWRLSLNEHLTRDHYRTLCCPSLPAQWVQWRARLGLTQDANGPDGSWHWLQMPGLGIGISSPQAGFLLPFPGGGYGDPTVQWHQEITSAADYGMLTGLCMLVYSSQHS